MSPSAKRAGKKVGSARKRKAPARKSKPKKTSTRKPKAKKAAASKPRARKAAAPKPRARKAVAPKPKARKTAAPKPKARKAVAPKTKARKAAAPKPEARKAAALEPKPRKAPAEKPGAGKGPSSSSEKSEPTKPRSRGRGAGAKPHTEIGPAPSLPAEPKRSEVISVPPTVAPSGRSAGPPPESRPVPRVGETLEPHWDTIPLPDSKAQLKRYYRGAQMPSPMGGFLEPLRVRSEDGGIGTVILECSASSLRFALTIPGPTRGEKSAVKRKQEAREDPNCPRHDPQQRLNRVGQYLVCPLCGVRYGRV